MKIILPLSFLALFAFASASASSVTYNVFLDTTSLAGNSAAPFSLEFGLADGSGTGDGNNAVVLSNFHFGTGSASGSALLGGGASGDLSTSVVLTDTDAISNYFVQGFSPGNSLSFQLQLSTNLESGGLPDTFFFAILDNTFSPLPTLAGAPLDALALINIDNPLSIQTFGGDVSRSPVAGGDPISRFSAPAISVSEVPEPSTFPVLGLAILASICVSRRYHSFRSN